MIDPRTVMVAIPSYGCPQPETMGSLMGCWGMFHSFSIPTECSHISLVRNMIAAQFLASPYEWLVCIDADMAFTRHDMDLLLQPCDVKQRYQQDVIESFAPVAAPPRPTRAMVAQPATLKTLDLKTGAAADILVCAEYTRKNESLEPIKFGMGFVRIHRSVFEILQELKHPMSEQYAALNTELSRLIEMRQTLTDEGKEEWVAAVGLDLTINTITRNLPDPGGGPRLWQMSYKGSLYHDYFPSGPLLSHLLPTAEWKGEDHGFFTLCHLAGIIPRVETRTRLTHIGRKAYQYQGPNFGGGQ